MIDVNRARTAPIPIAIPDCGGDGDSASSARTSPASSPTTWRSCGLFRPIDPAAFIQAGAGRRDVPNFQNWKAIGAQALVTGQRRERRAATRCASSSACGTCCRRRRSRAPPTPPRRANWRRIAHIIADVIYERLLGEKGYFDTRIVYIAATGPRDRRTKRLAIMDQDSENNRFLTDGSWLVLTPRFHPTRDEIAFMSYANNRPRVYLFDLGTGQQTRAGRLRRHDLRAAVLARTATA